MLSGWELTYTILIFLAFIILSSFNGFLLAKILKDQTIEKNLFWIFICLIFFDEFLILVAFVFKILSFSLATDLYHLEITLANWIAFIALILAIIILIFLPLQTKNTSTNSKLVKKELN
ncbi:hypothetical protein [Spiroplasma platyhelix]|uniref:Transmembrane protein n=1 Tax=Spiroplasma platyhelix PALS-1 TaxID=1276218 RepID=A0A846U0R4_9MOLU|nr:hypothetical protein [Spiroplasma platyhelix]MBE4704046.1 hypothetical protein [Spiroplasma platyhelix PALS-1]NKE38416.1 hypothetical protein [Spiroplasma platyhelix PALS-1]UJB29304.1 hypothetical protein SPLAT_v1c05400 [Spiroplasma platyhelix PALS-1]